MLVSSIFNHPTVKNIRQELKTLTADSNHSVADIIGGIDEQAADMLLASLSEGGKFRADLLGYAQYQLKRPIQPFPGDYAYS